MNKFLDDIANNTPNSGMFKNFKPKWIYRNKSKPKHKVITINNYERYWDNSTPTGHQIRIINQDDCT